MSSAEAFVRILRLLVEKRVTMVLCGFPMESPVGISLHSVRLFDDGYVELFSTLGDALECKTYITCWLFRLICALGTENAYLKAWFMSQKTEIDQSQTVAGIVH
jgi:SulP family sulfate permease